MSMRPMSLSVSLLSPLIRAERLELPTCRCVIDRASHLHQARTRVRAFCSRLRALPHALWRRTPCYRAGDNGCRRRSAEQRPSSYLMRCPIYLANRVPHPAAIWWKRGESNSRLAACTSAPCDNRHHFAPMCSALPTMQFKPIANILTITEHPHFNSTTFSPCVKFSFPCLRIVW